jgi:hypothetical protein
MYMVQGYPGISQRLYFTSPNGQAPWTFGGTFMATPSPGDYLYGIHSLFEPTVWKNNKHCFYELLIDYGDDHNSNGQGAGSMGYLTSADGFTFNPSPNPGPYAIFGGGNPRIVQQDNLLYFFTDQFSDFTVAQGGGVGLATIADP